LSVSAGGLFGKDMEDRAFHLIRQLQVFAPGQLRLTFNARLALRHLLGIERMALHVVGRAKPPERQLVPAQAASPLSLTSSWASSSSSLSRSFSTVRLATLPSAALLLRFMLAA
jgi:hypothetical protein